jgi:hypothetical protein
MPTICPVFTGKKKKKKKKKKRVLSEYTNSARSTWKRLPL